MEYEANFWFSVDINPAANPQKAHALSGVVTEHAQMYDAMTGIENLVFYGSLYGFNPSESEQRGKALLRELELTYAENQKPSESCRSIFVNGEYPECPLPAAVPPP